MNLRLRTPDDSLAARTVVKLSLSAVDGSETLKWVQVGKVGKFKNYYRDGKRVTLSITEEMLREMRDNFENGLHPEQPTELMVDYEHLSADPKTPTDGEAAAWYRKLELRENDTELWAQLEFTEDALASIKAKKYKFFSPEFAFDYVNHEGKHLGCTMKAGAITNRPFLQGMDAIELRAGAAPADVLAADLSFDLRRGFVERAVRAWYRTQTPPCDCWNVWVCDIYDDYVVFNNPDGKKMRADYTIAGDGVVTLVEPFVEVVICYEPLSEVSLRQSGDAMKTITLRSADNKDVLVNEDAIEKLPIVVELRQKLEQSVPKTDVTKLQVDVVALTGRIDTLVADNKTLTDSITLRDAKAAVEVLVAAGKASDGQRESLEGLYLSDKKAFAAITAGFVARVATGELGHANAGNAALSAVDEVTAEVATLRAADPKLTVGAAQAKVFEAKPALYLKYRKETEQPVNKD